MKVLVADDEPLAREMLVDSIREAVPKAEIIDFRKTSELLSYATDHSCDIAFLDINMRGMTGVELAWKLKEISPDMNIVFVTGYDEHTKEAMELHASGYIMKPVTADKIEKEIADLRYPVAEKQKSLLKVRCFGSFAVFDKNGQPVKFERAKAQELFAYLFTEMVRPVQSKRLRQFSLKISATMINRGLIHRRSYQRWLRI